MSPFTVAVGPSIFPVPRFLSSPQLLSMVAIVSLIGSYLYDSELSFAPGIFLTTALRKLFTLRVVTGFSILLLL